MERTVTYLRNDLRSSIARFDALHERVVRHALSGQSGHVRYETAAMSSEFGFQIDADPANDAYLRIDPAALSDRWTSDALKPDGIWIMHEAPPSVLAALQERGQAYLEFRLSPIRFANDLMLALRTNDADIAARIGMLEVGREECEVVADLLRLRARLRPSATATPFPDGAAVILGQVDFDLSLISAETGARLDLTLFPDALRAAVGERRVFYKPHPYAAEPTTGRHLAFLREMFGATVGVVDDNIYDLFCGATDTLFIAVSSGALQEASLFGLPTHCLHRPFVPLAWLEGATAGEPAPYRQVPYVTFADPMAWRYWLGFSTDSPTRAALHLQPRDLLRGLYRNSWGFWPHWDEQEMHRHDLPQGARMANWAFGSMSFDNFARFMRGAVGDSGVCAGRWRWFTGWDVSFSPDGFVWVNGEQAGRYVFFDSRALVVFYREAGLQDFLYLSPDGQVLTGFNSKGIAVSATRPTD